MQQVQLLKKFKITNTLGLHARAAAVFVRLTSKFESKIIVKKDNMEIDGKSILGVLSLAAIYGTEIEIIIVGTDAEEAMDKIGELINKGFGEGIA
ncbi:MAG: HPr family phosphocarrier protein [Candidatus Dadabacteria bacterium]|nr:HPr family phosphocarrier protein [Candidatus Dadabacteria bacterium]NIQ13547.1 HPr family phosphocarrier protein [Candidatus Dadabacteria bacterium]